jgi:hypothetical protein
MNVNRALGLSVVVLAVLCGCKGPWAAKQYESPEMAKERQFPVVVMDKKLKKEIRIVQSKAEGAPDGRLRVYCEIESRSKHRLVIQVQTVFRDEKDAVVQESTWEHLVLDRFAIKSYQVESLSDQAKSYGIRIKLSTEKKQK